MRHHPIWGNCECWPRLAVACGTPAELLSRQFQRDNKPSDPKCLRKLERFQLPTQHTEFAAWFAAFLPRVDLEPTRVADMTDGKLYHLAGLNLSRAWMLEGILSRLPAADARRKQLTALAGKLKQAGLESIHAEHYEGGHWLGSFAVYLVSGRGLR